MTLTPTTSNPPRAPMWPAILVALAGAAVGGVFGFAAPEMYGPYGPLGPAVDGAREQSPMELGFTLGAASGAGLGLAWWLLMRRLLGRAPGLKVIAAGAGLGVAAGVVSTLVLHAGLAGVSGRWTDPDWLPALGLCVGVAGVPAGLVTGLICGVIAWAVEAGGRRERVAAAPTPRPNP